jgi:DNA repair protein RadC
LEEVPGLGDSAITEIKIVEAAARRLALASIEKRRNLGSTQAVIDYCRTVMAFIDHEEFPLSYSSCT